MRAMKLKFVQSCMLAFQHLLCMVQLVQQGKRVHILTPDEGEYNRSYKMCVHMQCLLLSTIISHVRSKPLLICSVGTWAGSKAPWSLHRGSQWVTCAKGAKMCLQVWG